MAQSNAGKLYKVPLSAPDSFQEVKLTEDIKGADGITLIDENHLAVISNFQKTIFVFETDNDWKSARLVSRHTSEILEFPTTSTLVKGELYILNAKLNQLFKGNRKVAKFEILPLKDLH
jgi:hypothetical protein